MRLLREIAVALVVAVVVVVGYGMVPRLGIGGLDPPPAIWSGTFELDPLNSDSVSEGDDHIRSVKTETRQRLETEHDFGTIAATGDTNDNGRHRIGSARSFGQAAAPANPLCLQTDDYDSSGGAGADRACDDGRMWVEFDNGGRLRGFDDNGVGEDRSDQSTDGFFDLIAVPTNAIIIWDQATGDENCDAVMTAGDCPCGFIRAAEFDGIYARGAETVATVTDVPEEVGTDCSAFDGAVPDGACDGANAEYDDLQSNAELSAHIHSILTFGTDGAPHTRADGANAGAVGSVNTDSTGGGDPNYHPFRTVLYCRAT